MAFAARLVAGDAGTGILHIISLIPRLPARTHKPMRIGLLGGTFDPVHYGHLLLAESCREECSLDQVWFLPAATPPHKRHYQPAPAEDRIAMLELAISGYEPFAV